MTDSMKAPAVILTFTSHITEPFLIAVTVPFS
jgi:hypothetical protein